MPNCGSSEAGRPGGGSLQVHLPAPAQTAQRPKREARCSLCQTYLPGAQAHGGHLGAVVEHDVASHDRRAPYTQTQAPRLLGASAHL